MSVTSVGSNTGNNTGVSRSRSNVLSGEIGEEASGAGAEGTGRSETVNFASVSKVGGASSVGGRGWSSEELTINWGLGDNWDVLEDVTLSDDVSTGTNLERVSGVVVPVVVDSMEKGVSLNLW